MRKAMGTLEKELKKANMFLEVRDARIPLTSANPELTALLPSSMKRLVVFNKIDLAQEKKTLAIIKQI
jgi:ribosome biogenesis GTPase A